MLRVHESCHTFNLIPSKILIWFFISLSCCCSRSRSRSCWCFSLLVSFLSLSLCLSPTFSFHIYAGTIKTKSNSFIAEVSFWKRVTLLDKSKLQLLLETFQEFHWNKLYTVDCRRCDACQVNWILCVPRTCADRHIQCTRSPSLSLMCVFGLFGYCISTVINTMTRATHFFLLHYSFHADILIWTQFILLLTVWFDVRSNFLKFESNSKWFFDDGIPALNSQILTPKIKCWMKKN